MTITHEDLNGREAMAMVVIFKGGLIPLFQQLTMKGGTDKKPYEQSIRPNSYAGN